MLVGCNLMQLYSFTCKEWPNLGLLLNIGRSGSCWGDAADRSGWPWTCRSVWAQRGSVVGGVMKSCSFRSFCERARRDGSRAPGVSVHCCYSNNCNAKSLASRVTTSVSYFSLLVFTLLWHPLLKLTWEGGKKSILKQQVRLLRKGWLYFLITLLHVPYSSVGKKQ